MGLMILEKPKNYSFKGSKVKAPTPKTVVNISLLMYFYKSYMKVRTLAF